MASPGYQTSAAGRIFGAVDRRHRAVKSCSKEIASPAQRFRFLWPLPEGASFADLVALKGTSDIGDRINKTILGPLAKANNLSDMPDFNDPNKLAVARK